MNRLKLPALKNATLALVALVVALVGAEVFVRTELKIEPGYQYHNRWFSKVDSVYMLRGMYADSLGIFKVEPGAADIIRTRIAQYLNTGNESSRASQSTEIHEVYTLAIDFTEFGSINNEFARYIKQLKGKPDSLLSEFENEVLRYSKSPINGDGFRSIEMKSFKGAKKKILLLGDSFTWGHSTVNKTSSFADVLLSRGYAVYNTGVSGADPAQYEAIARLYIPLIQPDIVVVNFFMGNDVVYFNRQPVAGVPVHYSTNAGNMLSCPNGIYFTSIDSLHRFVSRNLLIPPSKLPINTFVQKTALGTLMWRVALHNRLTRGIHETDKAYWQIADSLRQHTPYSNVHLQNIEHLAKGYGSKYHVVVIPDILSRTSKDAAQVPDLFDGIQWLPSPVKQEGYDVKDGHFNDAGHKTYADFLETTMQTGSK